jgi:hypothetical protein
MPLDTFLDKFFIVFHTFLALFILFGWIWKKTRKINVILLILTLFSWLILGIWYGIGYCPLTEWHWQVRYNLGLYDLPHSYIKFLLDTLTGWDWNAQLVDIMTGTAFGTAFIMSVVLNISDWKKIHPSVNKRTLKPRNFTEKHRTY